MSLADLQPTNTKKAKTGAVNTFMRFLGEDGVKLEAVDNAVRGDMSGQVLVALMDRFGLYLALHKTSAGNALARHSVMQYFRQAKMWLLDRYPRLAPLVDKALLKKGRILEGFCAKRPTGKMVKQASACTKGDLRLLMHYLYSTAVVAADYQDAGLLTLMWYLFGRASDLTLLQKPNMSLCSENIFFVRFVRVKTSEEQGVTLYPDACPLTCPLTAIAVALVFQSTPSAALLPHLPVPVESDFDLGPLPMLSAILSGQAGLSSALVVDQEDDEHSSEPRGQAAPGIHAYVNRVLSRIATKAGVRTALSSHSFRRGGAQHANGSADLSLQWITDRGGRNLTTTNKALAYIFNTTKEDQKVAKRLSGHDVNSTVRLHSLELFDSVTRPKVDRVVAQLFAGCLGLHDTQKNISTAALNILAAYLIKSFPQLRALAADGPLPRRVTEALATAGVEFDEFIAWSAHLAKTPTTTAPVEEKPNAQQLEMLQYQAAMIDDLISLNKKLAERIRKIEDSHVSSDPPKDCSPRGVITSEQEKYARDEKPPKRRKSASTNHVNAWYSWYTMSPAAMAMMERKPKSDMRLVVAYMRLFSDGYVLDRSEASYRNTTLSVAKETAALVHTFLAEHRSAARSTGTVLKAMRTLDQAGELNARITDYEARLRAGIIVEPSFPGDLHALEVIAALPVTTP